MAISNLPFDLMPCTGRVPDRDCIAYEEALAAAWPGVKMVHLSCDVKRDGIIWTLNFRGPPDVLIRYGPIASDTPAKMKRGHYEKRSFHIRRGTKYLIVMVKFSEVWSGQFDEVTEAAIQRVESRALPVMLALHWTGPTRARTD